MNILLTGASLLTLGMLLSSSLNPVQALESNLGTAASTLDDSAQRIRADTENAIVAVNAEVKVSLGEYIRLSTRELLAAPAPAVPAGETADEPIRFAQVDME